MLPRSHRCLKQQLCALAYHHRRNHFHCYSRGQPKARRQRLLTHHVYHLEIGVPLIPGCLIVLGSKRSYKFVAPPLVVVTRPLHSCPSWVNTQSVMNLHEPSFLERQYGRMSPAELFQNKSDAIYADLSQRKTNERAVFTNSELSLKYVDVYGFDFDYTLVHYTKEVHRQIYEMARDRLVAKLNYPSGIRGISYDPDFAIRGLHCDIRNGLLMKVDAYNHIQVSSVYRGHSHVSAEEIMEHYGGTHIPMHVMDRLPSSMNWKLTQFLDLFSIPEATLLADISEYLISHSITFDPEYLFEDIENTVYDVHHHGDLHKIIVSNLGQYIENNPLLPEFLHQLKAQQKKLFLITNSPYWFVNEGMCHVLQASDWRDLFDVIIVEARKPSFFSDANRPFRSLNSDSMTPTWWRVTQLEPGQVYQQGNINDFIRMTGWSGARVLYFGDHLFSDLANPIMQHGWKTGAIIPELEKEIQRANTPQFKRKLAELLALEGLLYMWQRSRDGTDPELATLYKNWKEERSNARCYLKDVHNPRFGSVFRTEKIPTYFSRRLATFSNLYMSSLDNLMDYSLNHIFIPRRASLPHELDLNFDAVDP